MCFFVGEEASSQQEQSTFVINFRYFKTSCDFGATNYIGNTLRLSENVSLREEFVKISHLGVK